jgi:hypothetical protein
MGKWWEYDPGRELPARPQDSDKGEVIYPLWIWGSLIGLVAVFVYLILCLLRVIG